MLVVYIMHMTQPEVDDADPVALQCGTDAAAAVVADDHDVLHFQHINGVLDHRQTVEVGMDNDVGDVAVHEDLARQQADDLVGRDARVGTTDPQQFRGLQAGQFSRSRSDRFPASGGPRRG